MKKLLISIFILVFGFITVFTQAPKQSTIVIKLNNLPGVSYKKSKWEVSYELRIVDEKSLIEATKQGKLNSMELSGEKVGNFIFKGSFEKRGLSKIANRKVVLNIPFDQKIQEKLNNASNSPQVFLFYGSALVFDGKLKKNITIPLSWVWQFDNYPDAKFGMEFKVEEDSGEDGYSFSTTTNVPAKLPKSYTTTVIQ